MSKTATDDVKHTNLTGFYGFLKKRYRFPEHRLWGIIACTGTILNKVQNLTMSRADLERIRAYIKGIGLTGDSLNFYITSFIFYIMYLERAGDTKKNAIDNRV